ARRLLRHSRRRPATESAAAATTSARPAATATTGAGATTAAGPTAAGPTAAGPTEGSGYAGDTGKEIKTLPKWWNWQTHHLEGVAPRGMRVRVPPSAFIGNPQRERFAGLRRRLSQWLPGPR